MFQSVQNCNPLPNSSAINIKIKAAFKKQDITNKSMPYFGANKVLCTKFILTLMGAFLRLDFKAVCYECDCKYLI